MRNLERFVRNVRNPGFKEGTIYRNGDFEVISDVSPQEFEERINKDYKKHLYDIYKTVYEEDRALTNVEREVEEAIGANYEKQERMFEREPILEEMIANNVRNDRAYEILAKPLYAGDNICLLEEELERVNSALYAGGELYLCGPGTFMKIDKDGGYQDIYSSNSYDFIGDEGLMEYFETGPKSMMLSRDKNGIIFESGMQSNLMNLSYDIGKESFKIKTRPAYLNR
ncbi:MAG: hypothetical protein KKF44_08985 [Nanoarchaeota archaeon]|nr:hypothetical protein [Nanoarchaeota archaeon]